MTQEQLIIDFADKYLYPYRIKYKSDGQEIVPDLCPICNGGNSGDKHTFALSVEKGASFVSEVHVEPMVVSKNSLRCSVKS